MKSIYDGSHCTQFLQDVIRKKFKSYIIKSSQESALVMKKVTKFIETLRGRKKVARLEFVKEFTSRYTVLGEKNKE